MNIEASETTPRVLFLTSGQYSNWTIHALLIVPEGAVVADDMKAFNDTLDGGVPFVPEPGWEPKVNRKTMNRKERIAERRRAKKIEDRNDARFIKPIHSKLDEYAKKYGSNDTSEVFAQWLCQNRGYHRAEGIEADTGTPYYKSKHYNRRLWEEGIFISTKVDDE